MATITQTRTNLATNPSFEAASGTVNVRTNICVNPEANSAGFGWGTSSSSGGVVTTAWGTDGGPLSTFSTYRRMTVTTAPASWIRHMVNSTAQVVTPGLSYELSGWLRLNRNLSNGWVGVQWMNSSGGVISESSYNAATLTANAWTRVSMPAATAPTGAAYVNIYIGLGGNVLVNDVIDATGILFEPSPVVGGYFDGATAAAGDYTYVWSGTAHSSISYQQAPGIANVGSANAAVYQSTTWTEQRGYSLRITPTSTSSMDTCAYVNSLVPAGGWQSGVTYTVSATINLPAAQTGSLDGAHRDRRIVVYHDNVSTMSNQPANAAGTTRVSVTFTLVDATVYLSLRLYNGTSAGGGDVWWDDILIEAAPTAGSYFDGYTAAWNPAGYSPPATWSNSWSSTPDASTSVATLSVPLQDYQIQLPDSTILGANTPVGYLSINGLRGSAPTRNADEDRAGIDGSAPGMSLMTSRTVTVKWLIAAPAIGLESALGELTGNWQNIPDPSAVVMTARDYLMQQASGGSKPVSMLQFQLPGRSIPVLAFGRPGKMNPPVDSGYQFGFLEVDADWVIPDGKLYDMTLNVSSTGLPSSMGGAKFPWSFPVNFGPSTGGTLQVANGGKYPAKPVFAVAGPVTNPRIINPSTGQFVRVNVTLLQGDLLVIDSDSRVVRVNGVNRNNALDTGSSFFTIPPGGTSLAFASTDGGSVSGTVSVYTLNTYSTL